MVFRCSRLRTQAAFSWFDKASNPAPERLLHLPRGQERVSVRPSQLGGAESRPQHREVLTSGRSGRVGPVAWRARGHTGLGRVPTKQVVNVGGDSNRNKDRDRDITELAAAGPGPTSPSTGRRPGKALTRAAAPGSRLSLCCTVSFPDAGGLPWGANMGMSPGL